MAPLVAVTDHAADRYRQRVRGTLDAKLEIASRVATAFAAGRTRPGEKGATDVLDGDLIFVCMHDVPRGELVVITVWEEGEDPKVPRRYTDALERRR